MPFLFAATLFVSATLLFLVQPMVAKMVLPLLGGTPAVWNTCMVFFQAALLAGYAYAHAITKWLRPRGQIVLHVLLLGLPLLVLPISIRTWVPPSDANPIPSLLLIMTLSVGLPFFVLSATAPLLQKWFAMTDHPSAKDPYFLYAASNVGSMLALFSYPTLVEPYLRLKANSWLAFDTQSGLWAVGYGLLVVLLLGCAAVAWRRAGVAHLDKKLKSDEEQFDEDALPTAAPTLLDKLRWLALAFVPSSLMLGVTTYITLDIAAIPLLWVIPLGLYLLSFILVFARWPAVMHRLVILGVPLVILLLVFVRLANPGGVVLKICLNLLTLFMVAMVCHGELARTRPSTRYLTGFFLLMSLGGVLGGLFNALVAPLIFNDLYEYHVALVLACLLIPPLGAAGGTSLSTWVLKRFARRETRTGEHARRLVHVLDFSKHGWSGIIAGLLLDIVLVVVLFNVAYGFATFFDSGSRDAPWIAHFPNTVSKLRHWTSEKIDQVIAKSRFSEAQFRAILMYGVPILFCYAFATRPVRFGLGVAALLVVAPYAAAATENQTSRWEVVYQVRSFFGVLKVEHWKSQGGTLDWYRLMHGTTIHGLQIRGDQEEYDAQTYYHLTGPVGQVFTALEDRLKGKNLAFIGLGSGTLATYGRPGQHVDFYDIDRAVVEISAKNSDYFTYYKNCRANKQVILGDARLKMEEAAPGKYQLIAVDAFSSDAIPIHLITRQAIELYLSKLAPDGVLAVHISNRYLDLAPVLANLAQDLNLVALRQNDFVPDDDPQAGRKFSAEWVILARKREDLGGLAPGKDKNGKVTRTGWSEMETKPTVGVWTDDFSNLLRVFQWKN